MRSGINIDVTASDRARLEQIVSAHVWGAQIVLLTADGLGTVAIMTATDKSKTCAWRWQARFMAEGVKGLLRDKTRPPGDRATSAIAARQDGGADAGAAHPRGDALDGARHGQGGGDRGLLGGEDLARPWSGAGPLAQLHAVQRQGVRPEAPRRGRSLRLAARARDRAVGGREEPDQALDRTQPGLPLKRGRGATMTHDYKRNGTTTLFAALNILDGSVIGRNMQRHRHQKFIRFLNAVEAELPPDRAVTSSPAPSSGVPTPTTSSPPSAAGTKCWNQSTKLRGQKGTQSNAEARLTNRCRTRLSCRSGLRCAASSSAC